MRHKDYLIYKKHNDNSNIKKNTNLFLLKIMDKQLRQTFMYKVKRVGDMGNHVSTNSVVSISNVNCANFHFTHNCFM
jgi:hypothetical protein